MKTLKVPQTCLSVVHVMHDDPVTFSKHHCPNCLPSEGLSHHSVAKESSSHHREGVNPRQTDRATWWFSHPVIFFVSFTLLSETKSLCLIGPCFLFHVGLETCCVTLQWRQGVCKVTSHHMCNFVPWC